MVRISLFASACLLVGSVAAQARYGEYTTPTSSKKTSTSSSTSASRSSSASGSGIASSSTSVSGTSLSASVSASRSVSGTASSSASRSVSGTASASSSASRSVSGTVSSSVSRSISRSASSSSVSVSGTASRSSSSTSSSRTVSSSTATCPTNTIPETTTTSFQAITTIYTGSVITSAIESSPYATVSTETILTSTIYAASTTITSSSPTVTYTRASILPASTTVTVPTAPGFTAARCNPDYFRSTVTIRNYTTVTAGDTTTFIYTPGPSTFTFTQFSYTATVTTTTTYLDTSTVIVRPSTTVYSTRSNPTSTVYEACASNNIAFVRPLGLYFANASPLTVSNADGSTTPLTEAVPVVANDPADCCSVCQGTTNCAGSAWYAPDRTPNTPRTCTLFVKSAGLNQTCDPLFFGEGGYGLNTAPTYYLSNSACGQFRFF